MDNQTCGNPGCASRNCKCEKCNCSETKRCGCCYTNKCSNTFCREKCDCTLEACKQGNFKCPCNEQTGCVC